ncbi:MAG TPA: PadR family transcriptional regulator [Clostridiaceae bacterium]|nr:PadR family transcriptional regulator [Clostridiaceae bacterium]
MEDTKKYLPMTETAYYILLCLKKPEHGYGIMQRVETMTKERIKIGPGTMYGTLSKLEGQALIRQVEEVDRKKIYEITGKGLQVLTLEMSRLKELYENGERILGGVDEYE